MPVGAGAVEIANSGHESEIAVDVAGAGDRRGDLELDHHRPVRLRAGTSCWDASTPPAASGTGRSRSGCRPSSGCCARSASTSRPGRRGPARRTAGAAAIEAPWLKSSTHEFAPRTDGVHPRRQHVAQHRQRRRQRPHRRLVTLARTRHMCMLPVMRHRRRRWRRSWWSSRVARVVVVVAGAVVVVDAGGVVVVVVVGAGGRGRRGAGHRRQTTASSFQW